MKEDLVNIPDPPDPMIKELADRLDTLQDQVFRIVECLDSLVQQINGEKENDSR